VLRRSQPTIGKRGASSERKRRCDIAKMAGHCEAVEVISTP
jgi:hypothetical protein